ncbi:DUF4261 domain-containing protein [Leptolyngbyaceae cyanobacterium CCMR0082]|uniref:DUF4261 domain-containing protein n=1 Tax=Adonisia turfae CCMR0082 TaxID=2304604 RepID=A0A6M0SJA4_9CYAN|nr:DUF4261 domain-containing protein [Adonisia turfae]NEZ68031.1 DUF4261 domain-containing protein [Adonisia turfae CCMR0082]
MNQVSELPQIVIGIPGAWTDRSDIVTAIAKNSGGYLYAGMLLMHIDTQWSCTLEIYDRDPELRGAFEIAGGGRLSEAELIAIEQHTHTIYLSVDGGSFDSARNLMHAAKALLNCGGIAVKIESTGIAHSPAQWTEWADDELPLAVMNAFVTYVGGDGTFYSCGMHSIGHRDAVVTADIASNDAAHLLHQFLRYIAFEDPSIHDNETFSVDATAPRYRVCQSPCTMFPSDDLFHNPYGVWLLSPV